MIKIILRTLNITPKLAMHETTENLEVWEERWGKLANPIPQQKCRRPPGQASLTAAETQA
jgi:hypothetical protein